MCRYSAGFPAPDTDLTAYMTVTQETSLRGESAFIIWQQGTGTPVPNRYTYKYAVADDADNVGTNSRTIDVVTRTSITLPSIKVPASITVSRTSTFGATYIKKLVNRTIESLGDGEYFYGEGMVALSDPVTVMSADPATPALGETTFTVKLDILQLPPTPFYSMSGTPAPGWPIVAQGYGRRRRLLADESRLASLHPSPIFHRRLRKYLEVPAATTTETLEAPNTEAPGAPGRRRLMSLADSLAAASSADLSAAAGNGTNITANVSASSASASPAIDYDAAKVASLMVWGLYKLIAVAP